MRPYSNPRGAMRWSRAAPALIPPAASKVAPFFVGIRCGRICTAGRRFWLRGYRKSLNGAASPVVDYFVSVEIQPVEEDLVELSPYRIAGLAVKLLRVCRHEHGRDQDLSSPPTYSTRRPRPHPPLLRLRQARLCVARSGIGVRVWRRGCPMSLVAPDATLRPGSVAGHDHSGTGSPTHRGGRRCGHGGSTNAGSVGGRHRISPGSGRFAGSLPGRSANRTPKALT